MENTRLKCFDVSGVFGGVFLLCIISSTAKCNENNHVWDLFFLSLSLSFLVSLFLLFVLSFSLSLFPSSFSLLSLPLIISYR